MSKVLIIGASGFLGRSLFTSFASNPNYETHGTETHGTYSQRQRPQLDHLDIKNRYDVHAYIEQIQPNIVIHTAAVPDPDYCETNKKAAQQLIVEGTKHVVGACQEINAQLIYISTTYVYGGEKAPYREKDPTDPINYYGKLKVKAENIVQLLSLPWSILRFDFLYGYNGEGMPNGLVGKLLSGNQVKANSVQMRKPLFVDDVASAIKKIIGVNGSGIYHLSGPHQITKYQLCQRLATVVGVPVSNISPIKFEAQAAPRGNDTSLLTERLDALDFIFTPIDAALKIIGDEYAKRESLPTAT